MKTNVSIALVCLFLFVVLIYFPLGQDQKKYNALLDKSFWEVATVEKVEYAHRRYDNVNVRNEIDLTPLHFVARYSNAPAVADLLLDHGANGEARDKSGNTPFNYARENESLIGTNAYRRLVYAQYNNVLPDDNNVLLNRNFWEVATVADVESALGGESEVNVRNEDGFTPLHFVARYNNAPAVVDLLLDRGADIGARNKYGLTPLHTAVLNSEKPLGVKYWLDRGADIGARTEEWWTPLHAATFLGRQRLVELLLDHGADGTARDKSGDTALDYAHENDSLSGTRAYWRLYDANFEIW
ncbi:MAG: ankyrin repeat domain-containing protein [Parvularculales bacterium]